VPERQHLVVNRANAKLSLAAPRLSRCTVIAVKTLEITLSDEVAAQVEQAAQRRGVSIEDLLVSSVAERLQREAEFESAARYVVAKNAELYERLS